MEKKQIKKLAALVDAPIWLIKESLGIPIEKCTAHSLTYAILALENADSDTDEERAAFLRMEEILLDSLLKEPSVDKLREIFLVAHKFMRGSQIEKDILDKWDEEALTLITAAGDNVSRLVKICKASPKKGKAKRIAIKKIAELDFQSVSSD